MHADAILAQRAAARPWKRGLAWLALLGPLFFATYGLANWIAAERSAVGSIQFAWEQAIPFVAWTIVPSSRMAETIALGSLRLDLMASTVPRCRLKPRR